MVYSKRKKRGFWGWCLRDPGEMEVSLYQRRLSGDKTAAVNTSSGGDICGID